MDTITLRSWHHSKQEGHEAIALHLGRQVFSCGAYSRCGTVVHSQCGSVITCHCNALLRTHQSTLFRERLRQAEARQGRLMSGIEGRARATYHWLECLVALEPKSQRTMDIAVSFTGGRAMRKCARIGGFTIALRAPSNPPIRALLDGKQWEVIDTHRKDVMWS